MKTSENITKFLKSKNLYYLKDEGEEQFVLPYECANFKTDIHIDVDNDKNILWMGFEENLKNESNAIKDEILNLNTRLLYGTLGVSSKMPNKIKYRIVIDCIRFDEKIYYENLNYCFKLYESLVSLGIVQGVIAENEKNGKNI